jgi:hypothetical protein
MKKEEIDSIKIEHRGEPRYWNITMFAILSREIGACYSEFVKMAEDILRKAKGLGKEWFASNADIMTWSSKDERGILTPHRLRVTLDMVTKDTERPSDDDE